MTISTKYNPSVAWRTLTSQVFQLTRADVDNTATYRISVSVIDSNNPGAGQKEIGYYLVDFMGVPYSIIGIAAGYVDVQDDFRVGRCPTSGRTAIIYQTVYSGRALILGQVDFRFLHPLAFSNYQQYSNAIIWANDPNAKKVPFTANANPGILTYQVTQVDPEDALKTVNYKDDFGDDPLVRLIIEVDSVTKYHTMQNAIFTYDGELLQSLTWELGDPTTNGYILISRA